MNAFLEGARLVEVAVVFSTSAYGTETVLLSSEMRIANEISIVRTAGEDDPKVLNIAILGQKLQIPLWRPESSVSTSLNLVPWQDDPFPR